VIIIQQMLKWESTEKHQRGNISGNIRHGVTTQA